MRLRPFSNGFRRAVSGRLRSGARAIQRRVRVVWGAVNGLATFLAALIPGPQLEVLTGSCGTSTHRQHRASFVAHHWPPVANVCRGLDPRPLPTVAFRCGRLHNRSAGRHAAPGAVETPGCRWNSADSPGTTLVGLGLRGSVVLPLLAGAARHDRRGLWDVTPAPRHPLAHQTKRWRSHPERDRGCPVGCVAALDEERPRPATPIVLAAPLDGRTPRCGASVPVRSRARSPEPARTRPRARPGSRVPCSLRTLLVLCGDDRAQQPIERVGPGGQVCHRRAVLDRPCHGTAGVCLVPQVCEAAAQGCLGSGERGVDGNRAVGHTTPPAPGTHRGGTSAPPTMRPPLPASRTIGVEPACSRVLAQADIRATSLPDVTPTSRPHDRTAAASCFGDACLIVYRCANGPSARRSRHGRSVRSGW